MKKTKRGEVNNLPDHPENFDDDTLEDERCVLVDETKKKWKDMELISQKMELTFFLRRKEIIEVQPMVTEIQERWPALFLKEQVSKCVCEKVANYLISQNYAWFGCIYVCRFFCVRFFHAP